jgi:hypothetical protein
MSLAKGIAVLIRCLSSEEKTRGAYAGIWVESGGGQWLSYPEPFAQKTSTVGILCLGTIKFGSIARKTERTVVLPVRAQLADSESHRNACLAPACGISFSSSHDGLLRVSHRRSCSLFPLVRQSVFGSMEMLKHGLSVFRA